MRGVGRRACLRALFLAGLGCGRGEPERRAGPLAGRTVTFSVSLVEDERDGMRALLRRFEAATGAEIRLVSVAGAALPDKLTVEVRAGRPTIDLFAQDNLALRVLVDRDLVQDLGDVAVPEAVRRELAPPEFGGRRYFLPFRPNVRVTYVNRLRFAQAGVVPPRTTAALREVAHRLKGAAGGVPKLALPLAEGAPAAVTVSELVVAFGGDLLRLDSPGAVSAVEYLQGLWREGLLAPESLVAKYDTQVDFLLGETAWLAPNWPFTSTVFAEQGLLDRFHVYAGWQGPVRAASPARPRPSSRPGTPGRPCAPTPTARCRRPWRRPSRPSARPSRTGSIAPGSRTGPRSPTP